MTKCATISMILAALALAACTTTVAGRPGVGEQPPAATAAPPMAISAEGLLLHDGAQLPIGAVRATEVGSSYFISAEPPTCTAAILFKDSPLRPAGATGYAESAYQFNGTAALYAESIDVYQQRLNPGDVVQDGFGAVSGCGGDAVGVSGYGDSAPMQLSQVAMPSDGVLVWTMTRPGWTCDYGMAVIPQVTLMLSLCDRAPGFDMAGWSATRRKQIQTQSL